MRNALPVTKDLVLLGGGHSHVAVLKAFGMKPIPGTRLTVITREIHTPYSGMLPGFVAGLYAYDDIHIDLAPLCRFAGARLYHDEAVAIDLPGKRVVCRGRPPVPYDLLSIDTGATPRLDVPGAAEHAVPVKPIGRFIERWDSLCGRVLSRSGPAKVGIVGEGAGGVELLLAARSRLHRLLKENGRAAGDLSFHLFARGPDILPGFNAMARAKLRRILDERGICIHPGSEVVEVTSEGLRTAGGSAFELDEILWATSAAAPRWPGESGLAVDADGFVKVDAALRSVSHPDVFAAGDVAAVIEHPRPKAGVFAVRQGRPLARNLRLAAEGRAPRPFRPQSAYLTILGTGDGRAVASRNGLAVEGEWVWRWKDRIDRRFMQRFSEFPAMQTEDGAGEEPDMRCGGCGAKVGSAVLTAALGSMPPISRPDLVIGLEAPDDAAVVAVPPGRLLVHSIDFFRAIVDDPFSFGRIAANHSLGDLYAMGAEPHTALAIVTVPHGPEDKTRDLLTQLMAGARAVLDEAGAALVGGHTGEGAELALGFSVNGLADPDRILRKSGLRPGDALVLTKPLGTGVLFAADMRGKAKARWLDAALAAMMQPSRSAADCLRRHGATACTDVTGFGLAGHLLEMITASGVAAELDLTAIPLLDGAAELAQAGIASTLLPQNLAARTAIADAGAFAADGRFPLLFDPQTAGGLLAGVPADGVDACIEELRSSGYPHAASIGLVTLRAGYAEPIILR